MASLHVTLLYAGILGLLLVVLSFNMMKKWVVSVGQGSPSADLRRAEALVSSYTDYVPLTIILIGFIETSGAPSYSIHALGGALVLARLMHAFGSNHSRLSDGLRFLGAQLTYLILTAVSFACLYVFAMPLLVELH